MDTLVLERPDGRLFFTNTARLVRSQDDIASHFSEVAAGQKASPFVKWIAGDFVEGDNPNSNTQFWTKDDLALGEYSIKYSPLNMLHKQRVPVGFFLETNSVPLEKADGKGSMKIEALSGMWTHVFPFESALVDQADETGNLFYSMECRGTHIHCAGPDGCDNSFDYLAVDTHCEHLKTRSSVRHIVNPTFRGGALIIPPIRPGWKEAHASVLQDAVKQEAASYAELTESAYNQHLSTGADISPAAWEHLMASILTLGTK